MTLMLTKIVRASLQLGNAAAVHLASRAKAMQKVNDSSATNNYKRRAPPLWRHLVSYLYLLSPAICPQTRYFSNRDSLYFLLLVYLNTNEHVSFTYRSALSTQQPTILVITQWMLRRKPFTFSQFIHCIVNLY